MCNQDCNQGRGCTCGPATVIPVAIWVAAVVALALVLWSAV